MKSCACAALAAATISASRGAGLAERDVVADRAAEQEARPARHRRSGGAASGATPSAMFWPSMRDRAACSLVEAQDQVEDGRLAAARGADQRGHLAGLGDERHARAAPARPAGRRSCTSANSTRASRELERRLVVVERLGRRAVDDLEQHAHADQLVVEVEVEPREPLGRLVGEQERRDEREELRPAMRRCR